jgi:hypothetical protein
MKCKNCGSEKLNIGKQEFKKKIVLNYCNCKSCGMSGQIIRTKIKEEKKIPDCMTKKGLSLKPCRDLVVYGKNKNFKNMEIEDNVMYIDVGKHTVLIKKEDEGTVVDVFRKPKKNQALGEPITSTWALDNE